MYQTTPTQLTVTRSYIYRCTSCKHTRHYEFEATAVITPQFVLHTFAPCAGPSSVGIRCPECERFTFLGKEIKGKFNPDHKCDPRCTSATGNKCECQCGGKNHGIDYA